MRQIWQTPFLCESLWPTKLKINLWLSLLFYYDVTSLKVGQSGTYALSRRHFRWKKAMTSSLETETRFLEGEMHGRKACVSSCSQEIVALKGQKREKGKSFSIELKLLEA